MKYSRYCLILLIGFILPLTGKAQTQGTISLHLGEGGHYLYLDQVNQGIFPADTLLTLPAGDHVVSFFNSAYRVPQLGIDLRDYERNAFLAGLTAFTVTPGDTVQVKLSWPKFQAAMKEGALTGNRRSSLLAMVLAGFGGLLWLLLNP